MVDRVVFEIDSRLIEKKRRSNKHMLAIPLVLVGSLLIVPPFTNLVLLPYLHRPPEPLPLLNYAAIMALVGLVSSVAFLHYYDDMIEVNRVAVTETGLYPPFKRKGRRMRHDWFVPYKDIAAMEAVEPSKYFVPGFNIMMKDGYVFQLLTLDPISYVSEKECKHYEKLIRVVYEQVTNPENSARIRSGEDFIIPSKTFEEGPQQPVPKDPSPVPWVNLFSKEGARRLFRPRNIPLLLAIPALAVAYYSGVPTWIISLVVTVGVSIGLLIMEIAPPTPRMGNQTQHGNRIPKKSQLGRHH